jgi:hypothetical protein
MRIEVPGCNDNWNDVEKILSRRCEMFNDLLCQLFEHDRGFYAMLLEGGNINAGRKCVWSDFGDIRCFKLNDASVDPHPG